MQQETSNKKLFLQRGFKIVQNVAFNEYWELKNNINDLERERIRN